MWKAMARSVLGVGLFASVCTAASAQEVALPEAKTLETVVVTGVVPGPTLWQVANGNNVLWLLGTVSPLPKGMEWDSTDVEEIVSQADEVIAPGSADADISAGDMFKMALLARSAIAATRLPDGKELKDVLPAGVYARWDVLRRKYAANKGKVERLRPLFASQDLYYDAIENAGMTRADVVWRKVADMAKAHGVSITRTDIQYPLAIDRKRYKAGIAAIAESRLNDQECFSRTLDGLELELEVMKRVANAWAIGDMEELRELKYSEVEPACKHAYDVTMGFQQRPELAGKLASEWISAADRALRANRVTFAVLPIDELVNPDGLLRKLESLGYTVKDPSEA